LSAELLAVFAEAGLPAALCRTAVLRTQAEGMFLLSRSWLAVFRASIAGLLSLADTPHNLAVFLLFLAGTCSQAVFQHFLAGTRSLDMFQLQAEGTGSPGPAGISRKYQEVCSQDCTLSCMCRHMLQWWFQTGTICTHSSQQALV
jgi:hypothetical protein